MIFLKNMKLFLSIRHFVVVFVICFFASCDSNDKLISYLKPKKEIKVNLSSSDAIHDVSFLFVVDDSGSMHDHQKVLSENIHLFLNPIFTNYPYYNYNFAVTSMSPLSYFVTNGFDFFSMSKELIANCNIGQDIDKYIQSTTAGPYLHYSSRDMLHWSLDDLICPISWNIMDLKGHSADEPYFASFQAILEKAESQESGLDQFFGKDKLLILFFLSDAGAENDQDFKSLMNNSSGDSSPAEVYAKQRLKELELVSRKSNIRIYSAGPDPDQLCPGEGNSKPIHLLSLINLTGGLFVSVCDKLWGSKLETVFDELKVILQVSDISLNEIPDLDTIEVFFNGKKLPRDINSGWYFNPETLSVHIGANFLEHNDTLDNNDILDNNEYTVRYNPINTELLEALGK